MHDRRPVTRHRAAACLFVVTTLLLGACGSDEYSGTPNTAPGAASSKPASPTGKPVKLPQPVQELDIQATEYSFKITPDPAGGLKPGWTLLKFHNVGVEPHQVMFARIKDGVDMAELAAAGAGDSSGSGAIEFVDMIGGVSYIGAGYDTTALVNLTEGIVMAMCYVPDAKGEAHALMGMTTLLSVAAPTDEPVSPKPTPRDDEVVGNIELAKDGYHLPERLRTGWYRVRNTDSDLHELSLLRLSKSIEDDQVAGLVEDLAANRTPPVSLEAVGGMGAINAGFDGYLYLDLKPGPYLAVDFMPDPGKPRPHMLDGYYAAFSV